MPALVSSKIYITRNGIVLSFKDIPRNPLRRRPRVLELSLNARQIYFILLVYSTGLTFLSRIVLGLRRLPYHSYWLKVLNYPKANCESPSHNWLNVLNNSKLRCKVNANFAFKNRFLQHVNESETKWDYAVL